MLTLRMVCVVVVVCDVGVRGSACVSADVGIRGGVCSVGDSCVCVGGVIGIIGIGYWCGWVPLCVSVG